MRSCLFKETSNIVLFVLSCFAQMFFLNSWCQILNLVDILLASNVYQEHMSFYLKLLGGDSGLVVFIILNS